jgi:laminin alpha 1/2
MESKINTSCVTGVSRFDPQPCVACDCETFGSTGLCYADGSHREEGHEPGDCICKEGYSGPKCTQCAKGYHDYPKCATCPCSLAGTLNGECDGQCLCKENVEGARCDRCKPGYYALHEANPKGCLQCFCYGVTAECRAAELGVELIEHAEGWMSTDLRGRIREEPYWSTMTSGVTVAEEDMQGAQTYFWEAPQQYIGNRLVSYGQRIKITTSWHRGRGDTAGYFTKGPDMILVGDGGVTIASGFESYSDTDNTTMEVLLTEDQWYHVPEHITDIPASNFRNIVKPDFFGRRVFKQDFMKVLGSLQRILIRAKYHTDQLEGT